MRSRASCASRQLRLRPATSGICAPVRADAKIGPLQPLVIEAARDRRLDHVEIGRDVEVARAIQRGVADFQNLLARLPAAGELDLGQDRIAHGAERIRDQRRADQPRRIARAERDQAPAPALRHRQRQQIAQQIDDVFEIIGKADALDGVGADDRAIRFGQADRPADPGVKPACISTAAPRRRLRRHWPRSRRAARRPRRRGPASGPT